MGPLLVEEGCNSRQRAPFLLGQKENARNSFQVSRWVFALFLALLLAVAVPPSVRGHASSPVQMPEIQRPSLDKT